MTVVEVTIAAFLLILASLAALQIVDSGRRNTLRAEGGQVAVNAAERELEAIRNLDYAQVAMTSAPVASADPDDPRTRITGASFAVNRDGTDPAAMVVDGIGGAVEPGPVPFTNGDVSGDLYRFVTWRDDPNVAGTQNFKRVVVAASVNATPVSPERGYFEVQSDVSDPNEGVTGDTAPPDPGEESDQVNYWLSDTQTSAAAGCNPAQATPSTHTTHNTTGNCGTASGPDHAFRVPPPSGSGTLPDYSTDVAGAPGLQLNTNSSGGGCNLGAGSTSIHRWVTPTLNLAVTREAGMTLYTRQPTASAAAGTICVALIQPLNLGSLVATADVYVPEGAALPGWSCSQVLTVVSVIPPRVLAQFVCSTSTYPTGWTPIQVRIDYPIDISLAGNMTVALAVRQQNATDRIQFIYDHSNYPSRLSFAPTL